MNIKFRKNAKYLLKINFALLILDFNSADLIMQVSSDDNYGAE